MKTYKVGLSDEAKKDLKDISSYITNELKAPQASDNVLADLKSAIASLRTLPERIPYSRETHWKRLGVHCMVVRKYFIYFKIDETARQVNVIAVIYGKRDQMSQLETMIEKC